MIWQKPISCNRSPTWKEKMSKAEKEFIRLKETRPIYYYSSLHYYCSFFLRQQRPCCSRRRRSTDLFKATAGTEVGQDTADGNSRQRRQAFLLICHFHIFTRLQSNFKKISSGHLFSCPAEGMAYIQLKEAFAGRESRNSSRQPKATTLDGRTIWQWIATRNEQPSFFSL